MPFVQELSNDYLHRSEFSVIPAAYISTKARGTAVRSCKLRLHCVQSWYKLIIFSVFK
jgi:hypothetical protein